MKRFEGTTLLVMAAGALLLAACNPSGWRDFSIPFEPPGPGLPTIQDVSYLLDAPAGKHGFLTSQDDEFVFEDGTRHLVFGTNLTFRTNFPPCDTPDGTCDAADDDTCSISSAMAERLARYGINTVRLHHLDSVAAGIGIFDEAGLSGPVPNTLALDQEQLARLGCLIRELRQRGIYININLSTVRRYLEGDGVEEHDIIPRQGAKNVFWEARIKELAETFNRQLLREWVNPYTGLALADDPAVAFIELLNENSLSVGWAAGRTNYEGPYSEEHYRANRIPPHYRDLLNGMWAAWLEARYGTVAALEAGWNDGTGTALDPEETAFDAVQRHDPTTLVLDVYSVTRYRDTHTFHAEIEVSFWQDMMADLRNTSPGGIGVKVPIGASNNNYRLLHQNNVTAFSDFTDVHFYWDHPSGGSGGDQHNLSGLRQVARQGREHIPIEEEMAAYAAVGKPAVVSETNRPWPNEWRAETPTTAFYLAFQGWNGMYNFCWENIHELGDEVWSRNYCSKSFSPRSDPVQLALFPTMALAFAGGYITPGTDTVELVYTNEERLDVFRVLEEVDWMVEGGFDTKHAFTRRIRRNFQPGATPPTPWTWADYQAEYGLSELSPPYLNSTGELLLDADLDGTPANPRSRLVVMAPGLQGAVGDFGGDTEARPGHIEMTLYQPFATVLLVSLDGRPLAQSQLMLLTTVAKGENTGQKWNAARTNLTNIGRAPTRIQRVTGRISLRDIAGLETLEVYNTDTVGARTTQVSTTVQSPTELTFPIGDSVWYAIGQPQELDQVR